MSASLINIGSLVVLAGAGLVACCAHEHGGARYLAALCVALAASVVLTASSVVMLVDWPAQMEHFDFSGFRQVNRGRGQGPTAGIFFWPYYSAVAGVVAAYFSGRRIHDHVRGWTR
jgi:hypothetical protein